jgi:hypothetical protein
MSMKKSSNTIGKRTRNLLVFSAVPQPTALLRAPRTVGMQLNAVGEALIKQVMDDPCRREA